MEALTARMRALETRYERRVGKLATEVGKLQRRVATLETELRSRPPARSIASAFELLAFEASRGGLPSKHPVEWRRLAASLGRAGQLLSLSWPAAQQQACPGAPLQLCWFGNRRELQAPSNGSSGRAAKRATNRTTVCLLATMPQHVVLRIICALDDKEDLPRLRRGARVFALPQHCFPAAQPLVAPRPPHRSQCEAPGRPSCGGAGGDQRLRGR